MWVKTPTQVQITTQVSIVKFKRATYRITVSRKAIQTMLIYCFKFGAWLFQTVIYFNIQRCTYVVSNNIHELFDQKLYNIWLTVIVEIFIVTFWSMCVLHSIYLFKTFRIATTFLGKWFFYLVVDRSSFKHLKSPSVVSGVCVDL